MTAGFNDRAGSEMRASDIEREAMAAELREHYAAGRLTREELDERLDQAFASRTRGDLSAVMRDLPGLRPKTPPLPAAGPRADGWGAGPGWSGGTGWNGNGGPGGPGAGNRGAWGPARTVGSVLSAIVAVSLLATFGMLAAFGGIGGGRPLAIGLIIAAVALLRRLIFGRRVHARRGCGRRRP